MFAKGHGTQNDFVLLPDLDAQLTLTPAAVAALCDRRRGLGADGVLRVTTAGAALRRGRVRPRCPRVWRPTTGTWTTATPTDRSRRCAVTVCGCSRTTCGSADWNRATSSSSAHWPVPRPVCCTSVDDAVSADVTVDMGKANQLGTGSATVGGRRFTGLAVDVGNPHLACVDAGLTARRTRCTRRRRARAIRRRAVPRGRQRRGAHRACRRVGVDAGARARCRRNPFLRNRNRGRRRRRPGASRAPQTGSLRVRIPGGEVTVTRHRRHQLPARAVGPGGARRTVRGMVACTAG